MISSSWLIPDPERSFGCRAAGVPMAVTECFAPTSAIVTAGRSIPLRFCVDAAGGGLKPYVLVRGRLEARDARALL